MRRIVFVGIAMVLTAFAARAAELTIEVINHSGETITAMMVHPVAEPMPPAADGGETPPGETVEAPSTLVNADENILANAIAAGSSDSTNITTENERCLHDVIFVLASGQTIDRPDTDLCQTAGIIVE